MIKQVFKTMVAFLAVATMTIGPVRGQNSNVSWVLTPYGDLQDGDTVVIVDKNSERAMSNNNGSFSAPSADAIGLSGDQNSLSDAPAATLQWVVERDNGNYMFKVPGTSNYLYCTSDNDGVRVGSGNKSFEFQNGGTYNVPFLKNNATSRYLGLTNAYLWRCPSSISNSSIKNNVISFYKKTVVIIPTHTVRMAAGTEDAANWSIASGDALVPGNQVLENVMSGSQVTATYNGTTKKVKSVKAVKYVVPSTPLDNTMTAWADGRYAVPAGGLTYSAAVTVSGDVTLVLTDGTTLTLNKGISLASGATLTVEGTGTMNVKGSNGNTSSTTGGSGTITLTSGTLTATGGNGQNGGDLETGAAGGAAINGSVIVDGGTLTATGGNGGNVGNDLWNGHGGAGGAAIGGSLTINAGTVTTTNGAAGSVGYDCDECSGGAAGKAVAGTVTDNR